MTFAPALLQPIPLSAGHIPEGWRDVPFARTHNNDDLIPIGPFSEEVPDIFTTGVYAGEHRCSPYMNDPLDGATVTAFLRRHVAMRLQRMQCELPDNHYLIVFDGYRGEKTQAALYSRYFNELQRQQPELHTDQLHELTQRYVSTPSITPPSPHRTGGAVDLAIVTMRPTSETAGAALKKTVDHITAVAASSKIMDNQKTLETLRHALMAHTRMLNFGTPFDHGSPKAKLTYFEERLEQGHTLSEDEHEAMMNRRALYNLGLKHGMVAYAEEWWHLDAIETQRGAASQGIGKATLTAVELNTKHHAFEARRRRLLMQLSNSHRGGDWPMEVIAPTG